MTYGLGTRSYNRSTEKRTMDKERREVTARYEASERKPIDIPILCECMSFEFPHLLRAHRQLKSEHDWTPWEKRQ